jgi:hypothetical protein
MDSPAARESPISWPIGIFALCIFVLHEHRQSGAITGSSILQHLPVAGRVTEGRIRPTSDHQVNALRFAGMVVV